MTEKKRPKAMRGRPFSVDTRPTKAMVVGSLTRDISVEASLFDLIDNSIDAARETIFKATREEAIFELPQSYAGFEVVLTFSGTGCSVADNCGGIEVEHLKTMVLRFGEQSKHSMGIGVFGLGLNRAMFKLGRVSHLKTDTGLQRAELVLNVDEYLRSDDWNLPAEEFESTSQVGTSIEIAQLPEDIASTFSDADWIERYRVDVGRRYARFIQKGLSITVNGVSVEDGEVHIRQDGPFPMEYKSYKADGVTIRLEFGQHRDHRFSAEKDYDKSQNTPLTAEFGWTVICNDRAIVVSDRTLKTGWEGKFHSEFYGFVGVVIFSAEEPGELPWDTTKFDVNMNNRAYQLALVDMRKNAEKWRSNANQAKRAQRAGVTLQPLPGNQPSSGTKSESKKTSKPLQKSPTKKMKALPTRKTDHNQFGTVLPHDVDEFNCYDKHLALVHEAKNLDLNVLTYSGMALIRCLFETTVVTYLSRHGKLSDLKQFAIEARAKNKAKVVNENNIVPDTEELIAFLEINPEIWGAVKQNHIRHSLRRMAAHKKLLNSALHNPWQPINKAEAFTIRDDVLPILRHLIET
ncbi:MAG: ATP-binding protein [Ramlibacter sp.]|nr:ATP-binding protein [Ramlibacter sp.]